MPRKTANPDFSRLFQLASIQGGYFTAAQGRAAGYTRQNLAHHIKSGRFDRVARGFYRLREFPSSPHEDVIAAWVKEGPDRAVVSHETALALYDLSTVRGYKIDLTILRAQRPPGNRPRLPAVRIHTTLRTYKPQEVVSQFGVRLTSPARTIVDAAEAGTDPASIVEAVAEALSRGLVTAGELKEAEKDRPRRVQLLLKRALEEANSRAPIR